MALCGVDAVDADADHNAFEAIGKGEGFGLVRLPIGSRQRLLESDYGGSASVLKSPPFISHAATTECCTLGKIPNTNLIQNQCHSRHPLILLPDD